MTRFLASVTTIAEAQIAIDSGVDVIDLKNPEQGALGALQIDVIAEIVRSVAGRKPVSATVGDLPMLPGALCSAVEMTANTGVDIVKVGFFGAQGHAECVSALSAMTPGRKIIAVLFADQRPDFQALPLLADAGFYGVMLDTSEKRGGSLCDWQEAERLGEFVHDARTLGLLVGLAGSLRVGDIGKLVRLEPDYLGFRGALCADHRRESVLDESKVKEVRNMLYECNSLACLEAA